MLLDVNKRLFNTLRRGYETAANIGNYVVYRAGSGIVLDRLVQQDSERQLNAIATDLAYLAVSKTYEAETVGELAALHQFATVHGPKNFAEINALSETAPADPLALKQLMHWLDESLPNPDPSPTTGQQASL